MLSLSGYPRQPAFGLITLIKALHRIGGSVITEKHRRQMTQHKRVAHNRQRCCGTQKIGV